MKQSESIKELAEALSKAQAHMTGAKKGAANPFFKSMYADLTSVMEAVAGPFAENGLSYTQFPLNGENAIGCTTRLMHSSGQWLEQDFLVPMVKNDPQAAGSALSYAKRYSLQAVAGVPSVDDDGEAAMHRQKPAKPASKPKRITKVQQQAIAELLRQSSTDTGQFVAWLGFDSVESITQDTYQRAVDALKAKIAKEQEVTA